MNPTLKYRLKGFHGFVTNSNERKFFWLSVRYGNYLRYKPVDINFLRFKFSVPDALSFIWQFKEIFVEEYYRFETKSESPVIYDCGANVGTSCAYFKYQYPQSRIIAFEPNANVAEYLFRNIKNNSFQNIEVINKAVWTNSNGLELGLDDADASSIHLDKNKTKVNSVRLKDYFEKEEDAEAVVAEVTEEEAAPAEDVAAEETVEEAAKLMQHWQIKHLPVTDKGKLVGMITYLDIAFNVPALLPAMKKLYTQSN